MIAFPVSNIAFKLLVGAEKFWAPCDFEAEWEYIIYASN